MGISLVRVISALLLCLAAAVGIVLALRARGGKSSAGLGKLTGIYRDHRIRIIESRRISPHCDVCLFSFDDEEFLIACGSAGPTLLERRPFRVESPAQS
ncbi:MAG: hypothetical protein ABL926_00405 [Novosphingobium sp.]|uniref:hypothetical protein n=1 Tax=Novosphingobium sp. TaxID=1874826 RepID=UPI0032B81CB9